LISLVSLLEKFGTPPAPNPQKTPTNDATPQIKQKISAIESDLKRAMEAQEFEQCIQMRERIKASTLCYFK